MAKKTLTLWIVGAALVTTGCQNQVANVEGSRRAAETWVTQTLPGYELVGFSSATLDTDGDGYVSADISVRKKGDPNAPLRILQLQCPTMGTLSLEKGGAAKLSVVPHDNSF